MENFSICIANNPLTSTRLFFSECLSFHTLACLYRFLHEIFLKLSRDLHDILEVLETYFLLACPCQRHRRGKHIANLAAIELFVKVIHVFFDGLQFPAIFRRELILEVSEDLFAVFDR